MGTGTSAFSLARKMAMRGSSVEGGEIGGTAGAVGADGGTGGDWPASMIVPVVVDVLLLVLQSV